MPKTRTDDIKTHAVSPVFMMTYLHKNRVSGSPPPEQTGSQGFKGKAPPAMILFER